MNNVFIIARIAWCSLVLFLFASFSMNAQENFKWPNGAKAAISLTYDDGLPSHIHTVGPILKSYNFKATFYPTISSPSIYQDMDKWKALVKEGHELGNHTVYHPCRKSMPGMEWVKDYYDLDEYTLEEISDEITVANTFLYAIDSIKTRTFAYPCSHFHAGGKSYVDIVSKKFLSARRASGNQDSLVGIYDIDLYNIPSWAPNNHSAEDLISYIQKIIEMETYSTFTFHGIGAEHLRVSEEDHEKMLEFLDANRDKIWVATVEEISEYLKEERKESRK